MHTFLFYSNVFEKILLKVRRNFLYYYFMLFFSRVLRPIYHYSRANNEEHTNIAPLNTYQL